MKARSADLRPFQDECAASPWSCSWSSVPSRGGPAEESPGHWGGAHQHPSRTEPDWGQRSRKGYDRVQLRVEPQFTTSGWRFCDLHGVVVVGHQTRRLSSGRELETGVVGVAEDPLDPRQDPRWWHGLVWEVTWGRTDDCWFSRLSEYC